MLTQTSVDEERLEELRAALTKIPGSENKSWFLEVHERIDGKDRLHKVYNIKTGREISAARYRDGSEK